MRGVPALRNVAGRTFHRYRTALLAAATAAALPGAAAAVLVASEGGSPVPVLAAPAGHTSGAAPADQGVPAGGARVPASATAAAQVSSSAPATQAAQSRSIAKVVQKPPPVVDGVKRSNVGSAHSPQIQKQLSGSPATTPPPSDAGALGVDVADYQHRHGAVIDWHQVAAAGYKFAFIKATEGDYYINPYYASDLAQAQAAGLYATGYHFAIPNVSSGASQAAYAVRNAAYTANGRTLPLALDIEYDPYGAECYGLSPAQLVSWIAAFVAEVQRLTGQLPIIYTTADWWRTCTDDSTAFRADPLWVAGYGFDSPPMPTGWNNWTFWQFTSQGTVPGISGPVDVSYFLAAVVRLLDPGNQDDAAGTAIQLQVPSINAADGQSPQFTAAGLPPGLSIDGTGLISGAILPAATGTYRVTVTATYPSGGSGSVSFSWTVTPRRQSASSSSSPVVSAPPSVPPAPSPSVSPSTYVSPTPSQTSPSPSPSQPSPTLTPSQPSPTPTATPTPTVTSPSPSPSQPSPSPSPSEPSPSPSPSGTPSSSPSPSPSPT